MAEADLWAFGKMFLGGRYRGQARSHRGFAVFIHSVYDAGRCGSGLACDSLAAVYQSGSHPLSTNRIIVCAAAS